MSRHDEPATMVDQTGHPRHLDTVLHALRETVPDPAMQARLLARLSHSSAAHAPASAAQPWWRWQAVPWLAAAILAVAVGYLLPHTTGHPLRARDYRDHRDQAAAATHVLGTGTRPDDPAGDNTRPARFASRREAAHVASIRSSEPLGTGKPSRQGLAAQPGPADDIPTPPLPLTPQERLLLRMVRHDPPRLLAQLTGPALEADFQQSKAAVSEFFAKPTVAESEPDTPEAGAANSPLPDTSSANNP